MAQDLTVYEGTTTYGQGRFYHADTNPTDQALQNAVGRALKADVSRWQLPVGTVDFWIYFDSISGYNAVLAGADSRLETSGGTFGWVGKLGQANLRRIATVTASTWYWVVLQWTGTRLEWWVLTTAGELAPNGHDFVPYAGENPFGATGNIGIGGWASANAYDLRGRLDNLRISDTLRIPSNTITGLGAYLPTAPTVADANTVDLYPLDGTLGTAMGVTEAPMTPEEPAGKVRLATESAMLIKSWRRRDFNVLDSRFGAVGDGVTDDTAAIQLAIDTAAAAGGGRVLFPITGQPYLLSKTPYEVQGQIAQLHLPPVDYVDDPQIAITLEGELPAPITYSVIGAAPAADQHSILRSTYAGAQNVIGGRRDESFAGFTNLMVSLINFTLRMPPNPAGIALNMAYVSQMRVDGVSVDTGQYGVSALTEPTFVGSTALRVPTLGNGAFTYIGSFAAAGMYNGLQISEHTHMQSGTFYGCKVGVLGGDAGHTSHIERLNVHHQPYGVSIAAQTRMDISNFNIEHAAVGSWRTNIYDINDPSNLWFGQVRYGIGSADPTFRQSGGSNLTVTNIGDL